jgi:C4-dicarboxylate transporter, DctQ subunit
MRVKWLEKLEEYASVVLFVGGMLVSFYGVIMRYIFNKPPAWSLEIFETLMVWSIFIGFGMALRENHHIAVDLVYDRLPYGMKRILSVISNLFGFAFCIFMTYSGIVMTALTKEQGTVTIDVGIPLWIPFLIMPVGMGFMAFYFLLKMIKALKGDKEEILGRLSHQQHIQQNQHHDSFYQEIKA